MPHFSVHIIYSLEAPTAQAAEQVVIAFLRGKGEPGKDGLEQGLPEFGYTSIETEEI